MITFPFSNTCAVSLLESLVVKSSGPAVEYLKELIFASEHSAAKKEVGHKDNRTHERPMSSCAVSRTAIWLQQVADGTSGGKRHSKKKKKGASKYVPKQTHASFQDHFS